MRTTVELENGNKVHFNKHPRYGTYSVSFDRGDIPNKLRGEYQLYREIYEKTMYYLENRPKRNRTTAVDKEE